MITLVKVNGKPVSVGSIKGMCNCFPIENGEIKEEAIQRTGARVNEENFAIAKWAWENQMFDNEENH